MQNKQCEKGRTFVLTSHFLKIRILSLQKTVKREIGMHFDLLIPQVKKEKNNFCTYIVTIFI